MDNRFATALVIASVLSLLSAVYLSAAIGTDSWYEYHSQPPGADNSTTDFGQMKEEFLDGEFDEKAYSDTLFKLNGTLGLWKRCIVVSSDLYWYRSPDPKMVTQCVSFSLQNQFAPKYQEPGNHNRGEFDEKAYSDTLFKLNGTLGLWKRCIVVSSDLYWYRSPDPKMVTQCVSFSLQNQFAPKYQEPGNHNSGEDLTRTYFTISIKMDPFPIV
ncbi:UNVERIFIED_CONTAM: hypothetical protein FKN15_055803 [Acipenser sinensis]